MKIILFSDTHFNNNNEEHNKKLVDFFTFMADYAIENKINKFIFGGDAFDTKKLLNISSYNTCYSCFEMLYKLDFDVYTIFGNHDNIIVNSTSQHALKSFNKIMNLASKPKTITIDNKTFLLLPFSYNIDNYYDNQDYVICHEDILNAFYGSRKCEKGLNTKKYKNSYFLAGHFHRKQEIDNCLILGSPIYSNFGDNPETDKGFHILDTATKNIEFIKFNSPKYITYKAKNEKEYKELKSKIENDNFNHYRIEVNFSAKLETIDNIDIKYNVEKQDDIKLNLSSDVNDNINSYLSQTETALDKTKLQTIIKSYLKEI